MLFVIICQFWYVQYQYLFVSALNNSIQGLITSVAADMHTCDLVVEYRARPWHIWQFENYWLSDDVFYHYESRFDIWIWWLVVTAYGDFTATFTEIHVKQSDSSRLIIACKPALLVAGGRALCDDPKGR